MTAYYILSPVSNWRNIMLFSPTPMHIPDGFLSTLVAIVLWIVSISVIAVALRQTRTTLGERQVPLMGILAAAIFAGQMLNFSVTGGTSGHLLGAAIATILLGPWAAVLVMTSVVSIQALVFQDGGLLALGSNIFNMAVVGVFTAHFIFQLLQGFFKKQKWGLFASGSIAAWFSIFIASLACAIELAISGTSPANIAIPAMAGIHALIGVGEALITAGALGVVFASRKDLLESSGNTTGNNLPVIIGGAVLTLVLTIISPLASSHPDGLEWVAEQHGFIERIQNSVYNIIPDYVMPGIPNEALATIIAGIVGAIIVFGLAYGVARLEKKTTV
jgi:cobalt/nickel transport system permease protein